MTDRTPQTHTCIHCGGYAIASEKNARGELIWFCSYRAGNPWCKVKGKR